MNKIRRMVMKNKKLLHFLLGVRNRLQFGRAYQSDAALTAAQGMSSASVYGFNRYRVLMFAHYLEKGMCYKNPRPFGHRHVRDLLALLKSNARKDQDSFEYQMGISILTRWLAFFEEQGWKDEALLQPVQAFLADEKTSALPTGGLALHIPAPEQTGWTSAAADWLLKRHSVRDFMEERIKQEDLDYALKCFVSAPSACNRQMNRVYQVKDQALKDMLNQNIDGIGGLNQKNLHHFIITFDLAAVSNVRERNQGFFNAGLAAMNFANGLHVSGIGSCFVQWDKLEKNDAPIRASLGLPKGERIAVIICAGYYLKDYLIPLSNRRSLAEVYKEIAPGV